MKLSSDTLCRLYEHTVFLGKAKRIDTPKPLLLLVIHHTRATQFSSLSKQEQQSVEALINQLGINQDSYITYFTHQPNLPKIQLSRIERGFLLLSMETQWEIAGKQVLLKDAEIKKGKTLFASLINNWSNLQNLTTNHQYITDMQTALGCT